MEVSQLKEIIEKNLENKNLEFKRLFHGRGNFYDDYNFLTIDSIDKVLYVCFFDEVDESKEKSIISICKEIYENHGFNSLVLQRRYIDKAPCEVLEGVLSEQNIAIENELKYHIAFSNKNIGIFPDMKAGREYIRSISKDKNVLNLFSYTCAFSIVAIEGGAIKVVNVDMAKGALTQGRANHHLNNHDTKKVQFMPYNILKSWSRIKKGGPYDIIIIDPPSFQRGSFAATKDYEKIIKKLKDLANDDCIVLSCLNAPELDSNFIKNIFKENAPEFVFEKRLENLDTFPTNNDEKTLKNLVFMKNNIV